MDPQLQRVPVLLCCTFFMLIIQIKPVFFKYKLLNLTCRISSAERNLKSLLVHLDVTVHRFSVFLMWWMLD